MGPKVYLNIVISVCSPVILCFINNNLYNISSCVIFDKYKIYLVGDNVKQTTSAHSHFLRPALKLVYNLKNNIKLLFYSDCNFFYNYKRSMNNKLLKVFLASQ